MGGGIKNLVKLVEAFPPKVFYFIILKDSHKKKEKFYKKASDKDSSN